MIFDKTTLFSDRQQTPSTMASTNIVDLSPIGAGIKRDIGKGNPIPVLVQVVEDYTPGGTVTVACQVSDDEAFSTPVTVWRSPDVQSVNLKAGYVFTPESVQRYTDKRYMRLLYTVTGAITAGRITAGITMGNQSND